MTDYQELKIEELGAVTVVRFRQSRLSGVLEMEKLEQELYELADSGKRAKLVLDFSTVEYLSSQVLGILVSLNRKAKNHGGALRFCGIQPSVLSVLTTSRLDSIFDIKPDLAEALRGL